ncbi:response regulator [Murimonas intestini]|uniref:Stage 0 sporulation protein A homolog n=1 Tax=Murimonas intestini TaxID=1337051 RepID=A0AB73T335_9FIRM|nr:response regulator [Murimonas intestini]MCR1841715.1 response regulator [Murimonas intestini]MCR1865532.1 response regulator [Murimonas intestini]MCR1883887.1 response regulator [Murimonas intestini]
MDEKILIVDDALFMRVNLKRILTEAGYKNLLEAENGEVACRLYETEKPDLVLMDISMPVMDGIAALKNIRKQDNTAVVVMCSAVGQEAMIMESVENGAMEFIVKPFKGEQIVSAVKNCLENSRG